MSRRSEGQLFVGRLSKNTRTRDLEDIFEQYGKLSRCDLKYGADSSFAFVDYEDRRDAEDALKYENGRDLCGSSIIVEWAKGTPRHGGRPPPDRGRSRDDECYKCGKFGHWARDCSTDRYGYRRPRRSRSYSRERNRRRYSRSRSRSYSRERSRRSRSRDKYSSKRRSKRSRSPQSRSKSPDDNSGSKSPRD